MFIDLAVLDVLGNVVVDACDWISIEDEFGKGVHELWSELLLFVEGYLDLIDHAYICILGFKYYYGVGW